MKGGYYIVLSCYANEPEASIHGVDDTTTSLMSVIPELLEYPWETRFLSRCIPSILLINTQSPNTCLRHRAHFGLHKGRRKKFVPLNPYAHIMLSSININMLSGCQGNVIITSETNAGLSKEIATRLCITMRRALAAVRKKRIDCNLSDSIIRPKPLRIPYIILSGGGEESCTSFIPFDIGCNETLPMDCE